MVTVDFESYEVSVAAVLDAVGAPAMFEGRGTVLIKPNLINDSPPPVTTPVACCESIVTYIRRHSSARIIVGEGCGSSTLETPEVFEALGYSDMAVRLGVELLDLNHAPLVRQENPACPVFREMYLPQIAFDSFIVSVPVLKAHSLADITGTLKNMMGFAPPSHYSGRYGSWKKAAFHGDMQQSIIDLCTYRAPDLSLVDATVGLADFHLGGAHCDPPVNKLIAGADAWEVDRKATELLELDWRTIGHLSDGARSSNRSLAP
jgi:uncharacterized protein (DUF362 family)